MMAAKDSHKNAAATIKVCTTGPSENPGTQNQRVARQKPPKIPDFHRQFAKSGYRRRRIEVACKKLQSFARNLERLRIPRHMKTNILFLILSCTGVIFGVSGLTRKFLAKSDD